MANVDGVWHGSIDTELNARGRVQAEQVALHLARTRRDARAIYASPLTRTRHTAEAIARQLPLPMALEHDLREYHLGDWEGERYADLVREHRLFERMQADPDWTPGGGESSRQVAERLSGALRRIAEQHVGERIIVVSHGGALTLALGLLVDGDPSAWRRVVDNCSVSDLRLGPERALLETFNETDHLAELEKVGGAPG